MKEIIRTEINDEWAHSGIVEAGDYYSIQRKIGLYKTDNKVA